MENGEASKCLLGGKGCLWIDSPEGSERVGKSGLMVVRITFMGHFFWISFGQSICLVLSPHLVYFRVLPCVYVHLLAKMDSSKEVYGYVALSTAFPHTCVVEKIFLTSRIRNIWPFISFLARAQHFFWSSFWSICPQGTNAGCSVRCPSVLYLSPGMGREHR